ncbi:MAG: S9 family peptidase [Candidatus Sabulitectum sp.]|nr:S9 family peptidase [Candidatus Sabulitectum sp.]
MRSHQFTPEELFSEVKTVNDFSLSPDGKSVAFSRETKGVAQIFLAEIKEFEPEQLTEYPGSKTSLACSPKNDLIAFVHSKQDGKGCNLCTISSLDRTLNTLLELEEGSIWNSSWSHDGRHLVFCSNCEGSIDIFTIDADGKNLLRLTSGPEMDMYPQWSPDDRKLLFYRSIGQGPLSQYEMRMINRDGKELNVIGPEAKRNGWGKWSPDGKTIAFASNVSGSYHIGILDLHNDEIRWVTMGDRNYWHPVWSPDGSKLACQVDMNGSRRITITDVKTGEMRLIGPTAGLCSNMQFTSDCKSLVFTHEGPLNPFSLWYIDLNTDEFLQLTSGLPDSVDKEILVTPEEITYSSFDGLKIPALLFRPKCEPNNTLPPAIVRLHGGPNYQTFNWWHPRIQLLVNHGYLVLAPDFRGSTGYGKEFEERSIGDWSGGDLQDVIAAAEWLKTTGQADPDRIALLGGSYGGYLMLMAMARAPELWVAGVDLFGFVDLKTFHSSTSGWVREWLENQIGNPEENPEFYRVRSPITHCSMITAPLLILQGAKDERVPLSQAEQLRDQMENNGKECRLEIYKDEDHYFSRKSTQIEVIKTILCFLDSHAVMKKSEKSESESSAKRRRSD